MRAVSCAPYRSTRSSSTPSVVDGEGRAGIGPAGPASAASSAFTGGSAVVTPVAPMASPSGDGEPLPTRGSFEHAVTHQSAASNRASLLRTSGNIAHHRSPTLSDNQRRLLAPFTQILLLKLAAMAHNCAPPCQGQTQAHAAACALALWKLSSKLAKTWKGAVLGTRG